MEFPHPLCPMLPNDLICEVLLYLPVKNLLQMKCLNRFWYMLISDSTFAKLHFSRSIQDGTLANHTYFMGITSYNPPFSGFLFFSVKSCFNDTQLQYKFVLQHTSNDEYYVGSCHCFVCIMHKVQTRTSREVYATLWNPSTRVVSREYPHVDIEINGRRPARCIRQRVGRVLLQGFGYDGINDKYKTIIIHRGGSSNIVQIWIYTFGNISWTSYSTTDVTYLDTVTVSFQEHAEFLESNYSLNWLTRGEGLPWKIVTFDLNTERIGNMLLPDHFDAFRLELGVMGIHLSIFFCDEFNRVQIWIMKDYGVRESWIHLTSIPYPYLRPIYMSQDGEILARRMLRPIYTLQEGEILERRRLEFEMMIYNSEINIVRHPDQIYPVIHHNARPNQTSFKLVEGLLSPNF